MDAPGRPLAAPRWRLFAVPDTLPGFALPVVPGAVLFVLRGMVHKSHKCVIFTTMSAQEKAQGFTLDLFLHTLEAK